MRITKFGHACVRLEHDGKVVVLDPGMFTDPEAAGALPSYEAGEWGPKEAADLMAHDGRRWRTL